MARVRQYVKRTSTKSKANRRTTNAKPRSTRNKKVRF